MKQEMLEHLKACEVKGLELEELTCPLPQTEDKQSVLILPAHNLSEMIVVAIEDNGHERLDQFVAAELKELASMDKLDGFRSIVAAHLFYWDGPEDEKNLSDKTFEQIYRTYLKLWDKQEIFDEQIIPAVAQPAFMNQEWLQERTEDGGIALTLPAEDAYQAALWMPMGGFNECPVPLFQAAVFKAWQEQYGAVPVLVTQDSWVLKARTRPQTDEEALALAREHFVFCEYILEYTDTIGHYADYLKNNDIWYFWWD